MTEGQRPQIDWNQILRGEAIQRDMAITRAGGAILGVVAPWYAADPERGHAPLIGTHNEKPWEISRMTTMGGRVLSYILTVEQTMYNLLPKADVDYTSGAGDLEVLRVGKDIVVEAGHGYSLQQQEVISDDIDFLRDLLPSVREAVQHNGTKEPNGPEGTKEEEKEI